MVYLVLFLWRFIGFLFYDTFIVYWKYFLWDMFIANNGNNVYKEKYCLSLSTIVLINVNAVKKNLSNAAFVIIFYERIDL